MKLKKYELLRKTASYLSENPQDYNWKACNKCNCGTLIKICCDIPAENISNIVKPLLLKLPEEGRSWASLIEYMCPISKLSGNEIFDRMHELGFIPKEMKDLEYLDNKKVCENAKIPYKEGTEVDIDYVIKYLNTWADMLEKDEKDTLSLLMFADQINAKFAPNNIEEIDIDTALPKQLQEAM